MCITRRTGPTVKLTKPPLSIQVAGCSTDVVRTVSMNKKQITINHASQKNFDLLLRFTVLKIVPIKIQPRLRPLRTTPLSTTSVVLASASLLPGYYLYLTNLFLLHLTSFPYDTVMCVESKFSTQFTFVVVRRFVNIHGAILLLSRSTQVTAFTWGQTKFNYSWTRPVRTDAVSPFGSACKI